MEYEVFEPPQDEYFDMACRDAYARMFDGRSEPYESCAHADDLRFVGNVPDNGHCASDDDNIWLKGA